MAQPNRKDLATFVAVGYAQAGAANVDRSWGTRGVEVKGLPRRVARYLLALFFVGVGVTHFTNEEAFIAIVPPYLPAARALVWISGVFEILGGLGVLFVRTRRRAGIGLIALLVAVFPANVHMALHPEAFPELPAWGLYARLPFQLLFIAWVWWVTKPDWKIRAPASGR